MAYYLLGLRITALLLSCYGYFSFIRQKQPAEFIPGICFTTLCSIMFFSGILNIMKETAYAVCLVGIILAFRSIHRKESPRFLLRPGIILFLCGAVVLLPLMYGMILTDYDDFSHWGTVLKVLFTHDRFPNYTDKAIAFQSYPPGSAAFIYYFVTISGITAEWFQLYIQAIFMLGILASLFAFVKAPEGWLLASLSSVTFLLSNNGVINLLVDTLLPVVALGGVCICLYHKDDLPQHLVWIFPHLIALTAIKNSGILFAVFLIMYALPACLSARKLRLWLCACACPALTLLLWQKHVTLVFSNGLTAKHSMSVSNIIKTFLQKQSNDFVEITKNYISKILSADNSGLYLLALVVLLLIGIRYLHPKHSKNAAALVAFAVGCYVIYAVFLLAMYLTTMPVNEALTLAGYRRYHRTILLFCGGCLYLATALCLLKPGSPATVRITACILSAVLTFLSMFPWIWYNNPKYCGFIREEFEETVSEYQIEPEKRYLVVLDSDYASKYSGYLKNTIRYLLVSANSKLCSISEFEAGENSWDGYDYLIFFGQSQEMEDYLKDTFSSTQRVYARS